MLRSKTFRLFVKFSCPDTSITDMSIHMATDSAEMEDAVGSEVWTRLQGAKMDMDINAIVERIQEASEQSYNYYKPLVDSIIAEKASEKEVEYLLDYMLDACHDERILEKGSEWQCWIPGFSPMQTLTAVSVFFMISFFTTDSHMMIMDMEPMLPGSWQEMAECPLAGIQVRHLAAALLL